MELKDLLYEKVDGIGIITLNRPKAMNALNDTLIKELSAVLDEIAGDPEIRAVIITGGAKVFAAGGDIAFMIEADAPAAEQFVEGVREAFEKIEKMSKPVVAAISGLALGGGCELAMACDIRIAAEGTLFGQPEINLGIMPGAGGTQRLTRLVGPGWAKYMILTGQNIDAETALKIGLVTRVVGRDDLMEEARKTAGLLASKSPIALKTAKSCIDKALEVDLDSGLSYEIKSWALLFTTQDQKEGMRAFLEKRKAVFKGK